MSSSSSKSSLDSGRRPATLPLALAPGTGGSGGTVMPPPPPAAGRPGSWEVDGGWGCAWGGWAEPTSRSPVGTPATGCGCTTGIRGAVGGATGAADTDANPASLRRSEEHTSELQSRQYLVCRLLLEKKKPTTRTR